MSAAIHAIQDHWAYVGPFLVIRNEQDYQHAIERLNFLIDEVGTNEQHPLYEFLDTLGSLIHTYEEEHYPIPESSGIDILSFLMDEHGLKQADLPEIGSQGVVSEIMHGKRSLNVRQMRALAARFCVSPAVFF